MVLLFSIRNIIYSHFYGFFVDLAERVVKKVWRKVCAKMMKHEPARINYNGACALSMLSLFPLQPRFSTSFRDEMIVAHDATYILTSRAVLANAKSD